MGSRLFAAALLFAAFAKARSPWAAASLLPGGFGDFGSRLLAVDAVSIAECAVGAALLFGLRGARPRLTALAGALLGALLLLEHLIFLPGAGCGCYGAFVVPEWITAGTCVLGTVACAVLFRAPEAARGRRWLRAAAVALVVVACVGSMRGRAANRGTREARLKQLLLSGSSNTLVLVGSRPCPSCMRAAQTLRASRSRLLARGVETFVFAYRASAPGGPREPFAWMESHALPDDLWWQVIDGTPPTFVRIGPGGFRVGTRLGEVLLP